MFSRSFLKERTKELAAFLGKSCAKNLNVWHSESFFAYFLQVSHCSERYAKLNESFFAHFLFQRKWVLLSSAKKEEKQAKKKDIR